MSMVLPACFESGAQDPAPATPPAAGDPPAPADPPAAADPPPSGNAPAAADPSADPNGGSSPDPNDLPWECQIDDDVLADYDPSAAAEDASAADSTDPGVSNETPANDPGPPAHGGT